MSVSQRGLAFLLLLLVLGGAYLMNSRGGSHSGPEPAIDKATRAQVHEKLGVAIQHEMTLHEVDALSVALIDDGRASAAGFGHLDADGKMPTQPDTVYRLDSILNLFTAIVIMQLVEEGKLDLDVPVNAVLPDFKPANPYSTPVSLRHLLTHRSGLVRVPPMGHRSGKSGEFDASHAEPVAGLNRTALGFKPGTAMKYSHAGEAVLGAIVEKVTGEPFETVIGHRILKALNMESSAFGLTEKFKARAAQGVITSYDDPRTTVSLENAKEGFYSTVTDLATFLSILTKDKSVPKRMRGLSPELLEKMWTPQHGPGRLRRGLGFVLEEISGARTVGHGSTAPGFAADVRVAPDRGVGVAIAANLDRFPVSKLGRYAMRLLLAAKAGKPLPEYRLSEAPSAELISEIAGTYQGQDKVLELREHGRPDPARRLFVEGRRQIGELRRLGTDWVLEEGDGTIPVTIADGRLTIDNQVFERVQPEKPAPPDDELAGLVGQYGWAHHYIRVYEWNERPHVRVEWRHHYEIAPVSKNVYAFPDEGFYAYERLRFERDENGRAVSVTLNGIVFPRRDFGAEFEARLQAIMRPRESLKAEALAARPPEEEGEFLPADLVDLTQIDATIKPALAYATSDNLFGFPVYDKAKAIMQRPAAEALGRVSAALRPLGYGLWIHDAYRPWYVTKIFWDATPEEGKLYVAKPWEGSRHNRGAAADLTLYRLDTGEQVEMAARLDEVSMRSSPFFVGGTDLQRWRRDLLRKAMEAQGFSVYPFEWWHFDFRDWRKYRIQNIKFEELE